MLMLGLAESCRVSSKSCCSSVSIFEGNPTGISQRQWILKLDPFVTPAPKVKGTLLVPAPLQTLISSRDHNGPNIPARLPLPRFFAARFLDSLWARLTQEASSKFPCPEVSLGSALSPPCPHQADGAPSLVLEVLLAPVKRNTQSCP